MKRVYIIQMHTGTLPASIVRVFTRYPYSHVGISFDSKCGTMYSFGRKYLYNFLIGGFVQQHANDAFFQRFKYTECRILELSITQDQYQALKERLDCFKRNEQKYHYDFRGLFLRELLKRPITFQDYYVCSHFVAEVLECAGVYQFGKPCCMVKPKDFDCIEGIREIYRGAYPVK